MGSVISILLGEERSGRINRRSPPLEISLGSIQNIGPCWPTGTPRVLVYFFVVRFTLHWTPRTRNGFLGLGALSRSRLVLFRSTSVERGKPWARMIQLEIGPGKKT